MRANESKFGTAFDCVAQDSDIEVLKTPYRAPRANVVSKRFLCSGRRECFDDLLIFNERQLYCVVREYASYFNRARPHQGIKQQIPAEIRSEGKGKGSGKIISLPVLGERHHDYRRVAWLVDPHWKAQIRFLTTTPLRAMPA